ncbi:uncharacterized protein BXIN_2694 [Babesia sp. Xinjiang]|uniref:uncharacterized protein n=1 Tax=Babesia sp. Xinjiang TaxID=462227 RepID=UPI000A22CFA7|nr:uncharacterized protein BXIN_2626 [Babesia sp. Xinjiang]XP_028872099.1 uncharacterized protein BXIN_2694 [Babesia sp. Xinjiang]ORM41591.1 hypothetical protein BXIN_2626 [Babesia sp. Xinjiang]ORM41643.1 hypothetical protein BXIN_2694 [Babesia sp. Xinjiang]
MRGFRMGMCAKRQPLGRHEVVFEEDSGEPIATEEESDRFVIPGVEVEAVAEAVAETEVNSEPSSHIVYMQDENSNSDYQPLLDPVSDEESDEMFDTIQGIYNLGVTESHDKAAIYGRMMHYYTDPSTGLLHPYHARSKSVLWYMLAILISNPIIGLYTMSHFKDWDTWVTRDVVVRDLVSNVPEAIPYANDNGFREPVLGDVDPPVRGLTVTKEEFATLSGVAKQFSQKVTWYAYYEVFGELIFAFFSLALLCTSGMCCTNGRHRAQSMIPVIGLLYTIIYKALALYVLIISFKILFFYFIAAYSDYAYYLSPVLLRLLSLAGMDATDPGKRIAMSQLLDLDASAHKWVFFYCVENVYITITESVETIHALFRILSRCAVRMLRRIRRQHDLVYFTMNTLSEAESIGLQQEGYSCSYMLLDSLLNRTAGPQEAYIHQMYNNAKTDVGTYLDNVDVELYQHGIEEVGAKLMNQLRSKEITRPN